MSEPKLVVRARELSASAARAVTKQVRRAGHLDDLPALVTAELVTSVRRVAGIRTPKDLIRAVEAEAGRLSQVVIPVLASHPLPVESALQASALAAGSAAIAAGFATIDELAIIVTDGVAAPTAAAAAAGLLAAFVVELWAAVSVRVHEIERAGRVVDPVLLADEVTAAVLRTDVMFVRQLAGRTAAAAGRRIGRRWVGGLVPVAGMVIDGVAASRTVRIVAALPVDGHPLQAGDRGLRP